MLALIAMPCVWLCWLAGSAGYAAWLAGWLTGWLDMLDCWL